MNLSSLDTSIDVGAPMTGPGPSPSKSARIAGGKTALQYAKDMGHAECVKVLSEAAAAADGRAGADSASSGAAAAAMDAPLLGQRVVLGGLSSHLHQRFKMKSSREIDAPG